MSDYHGVNLPAEPGSCVTAWVPLYTKEMETTSLRGVCIWICLPGDIMGSTWSPLTACLIIKFTFRINLQVDFPTKK